MSRPLESPGSAAFGWAGVGLGLACLMALALGIRSLGFEFVFVGDEVVFPPADAQYHLRRAFYTFANFPAVLLFDPYINYPGGASVPWAPLFDFVLGSVARLLADTPRGFEQVAAWAGPACGALTLIPVYWAGSLLGSRSVGFAAALCYACLPIGVAYSRVGNPDHHSAVAMLGAWLLLACLGLLEADAGQRRVRGWGGLLGAAQLLLLLTWHGSLLYLGLANFLLIAVGIIRGGQRVLVAQAAAAGACSLLLVPGVLFSPEPLGGWFSSIALSWLHVLATGAVAVVATALWLSEWRLPEGGILRRGLVAAGTGAVGVCGAMLVPEVRDGLEPAFQFLFQTDGVGAVTGEQRPLFAPAAGVAGANPVRSWGWLVYTIPFAPAAVFGLAGSRGGGRPTGASAILLGSWGLFFALLTLGQRRYGNDFAPAFALFFGVAAIGVVRVLSGRIRGPFLRAAARAAGVVVLLVVLLWPVLIAVYGPRARSSLAALEADRAPSWAATRSVAATLSGFMADVRALTPETGAYLSPGPPPAYGVIAHANLGHAIQYGARRATATDPFWWYIGRKNWDASLAFLEARTEARALGWADVLAGRYLITTSQEAPWSVAGQLHAHDGRATGSRPGLTRFRLLGESLPGGAGVSEIFRPESAAGVAYKLFQIVPGARAVIEASPGEIVEVSLDLRSNRGRVFGYAARAVADESGEAVLRLPYSTDRAAFSETPRRTQAAGPYRVKRNDGIERLWVPESAVLAGAEVRVPGR